MQGIVAEAVRLPISDGKDFIEIENLAGFSGKRPPRCGLKIHQSERIRGTAASDTHANY
jgi:hypothetical protein